MPLCNRKLSWHAMIFVACLSFAAMTASAQQFCDNFDQGLTGWTIAVNNPQYVTSPTHNGSGAVRMYSNIASYDCHSALYKTGFSASTGYYSAWVRQENYAAGMGLFIQVQPGSNANPYYRDSYHLRIHASDAQPSSVFVLERYRPDGSSYALGSLTPTFVMNEWFQIFIRRFADNQFEIGYIRNGQTYSTIVSDPNPPMTTSGAFYLWGCANYNGASNYFDDVCYEPLAPLPVANHDNPAFGASYCFSGSDNWIEVPNNPNLNVISELSIEGWIKMDQLPSGGSHYTIVSKWIDPNIGGTATSGGWILVVNGSDDANRGKLLLHIRDGHVFSNQSLTAGQWYHIAVTINNGTARFYVNGTLDNTASIGTGLDNTDADLAIGANSHHFYNASVGAYYFKGEIDEVRISNRVRSPYEFGLTGPCTSDANTVALWHLDEASGTSIADASSFANNGTANGSGCGGQQAGISRLFLIGSSELPTQVTCGVPSPFSFAIRNYGDGTFSQKAVVCSLFVLDRCDRGASNSFWCKIYGPSETIVREIHVANVILPSLGPGGVESRIDWPYSITFVSPHYTDDLYLKLSTTDGVSPIDGTSVSYVDNYFENFTVLKNPDAFSNCAWEMVDIVATALQKAKGLLGAIGFTADALSKADECIITPFSENDCILDPTKNLEERGNCLLRETSSSMACLNDVLSDQAKNLSWSQQLQVLGVLFDVISVFQTEFLQNAGCASVFVDGCESIREYGALPLLKSFPNAGLIFYLCSPADLTVVDSNGRSNSVASDGEIEINTPNAAGTMLDHAKAVLAPPDLTYSVVLKARETGQLSFHMVVPQYFGHAIEVSYPSIDCSPSLRAYIDQIGEGVSNYVLNIDADGNGTVDSRVLPLETTDSAIIRVQLTGIAAIGVPITIFNSLDSAVAELVTNGNGAAMSPELMAGQYHIAITTPLGFQSDQEIKEVSILDQEVTISFNLIKVDLAAHQRSRAYWATQLTRVLAGKPQDYSKAQFSKFGGLIDQHFNNNPINPVENYMVPQPATQLDSLKVLNKLLNFQCIQANEPFLKRIARGELVALMLNVVSGKVSQTQIITKDGMTLSQAITYCDMLVNDLDCPVGVVPAGFMAEYPRVTEVLRYIKASFVAGLINVGVTLPEGTIPADIMNIAYRHVADNPPIPTEFNLSQNRPNPFNPITEISFDLPAASDVQLDIYNITGQRVATLVNGHLEAGHHAFSWDGSGVSSGIYLYRLQAGEFVGSRKMVLLK